MIRKIEIGVARVLACVALVSLAGLLGQAVAAGTTCAPPRGQLIDKVVTMSDPGESYALYLPSNYDGGRRWPVLFVMDPRGRAVRALRLFQAAAEEGGYILVSSYGTRSDGTWAPNGRALAALLDDVPRRFRVHERRFYFAGMSGTARVAWAVAGSIPENVAGVIGFAAGFPISRELTASNTVPYYGAAGDADFNFEEVYYLEERLEKVGTAHRIVLFAGAHGWPPEGICRDAVEWMCLRAMATGLMLADDEWIDARLSERIHLARSRKSDPFKAHRLFASVVADFAAVRDVEVARVEEERLGRNKEVRATAKILTDARKRHARYYGKMIAQLRAIRESNPPASLGRSLRTLEINSLKKTEASHERPVRAAAARRLLELVYVHTSFYQPRELIETSPAAALRMLELAAAVRPERPQVHIFFARVYARLGKGETAVAALTRAHELGLRSANRFEADAALEMLRDRDDYRRLIERMRALRSEEKK